MRTLVVGFTAALAASLPAAAATRPPASWPQFRNGPAHTGSGCRRYDRLHRLQRPACLRAARLRRAVALECGARRTARCARCRRRHRLRLRRQRPIGQSRFFTFTAPAVAGSRIVFPSPSGYLVAHAVNTGKRLWRAPLKLSSSAPAIANGVVYVGAGDGSLYAFALKDGKRLSSARIGSDITSSPTVVNGAVYIGSEDGDVVAFRRR